MNMILCGGGGGGEGENLHVNYNAEAKSNSGMAFSIRTPVEILYSRKVKLYSVKAMLHEAYFSWNLQRNKRCELQEK